MSASKSIDFFFTEYPALEKELQDDLKRNNLWDYKNNKPIQTNEQSSVKGLYTSAYNDIFSHITGHNEVEERTQYWFSKSPETNGDTKSDAANDYIRGATQYGLEYNNRVVGLNQSAINSGMQRTSNLIGQNVLSEVFLDHGIPDFNTMISGDISAAIGNLHLGNFLQTMGGWGGSFYYWDATLSILGGRTISVGNLIKNGGTVLIGAGNNAVSTQAGKSINEFYFDNSNAIVDFIISVLGTFAGGGILKSIADSWTSYLSKNDAELPDIVKNNMAIQYKGVLFARHVIGHYLPGPHSVSANSMGPTQVTVDGDWATTTYLDGSSYSQNSFTNIVRWTKPGSNGDVVALADGSERVDTFGAIADNSVAVPEDITVYNIDGSVTESSGSGLQYANVNGNQELG